MTDPHNVGAILRSAVAFAADAIVTTGRHTAAETGTLAKAASGALDQIKWVEVQNLARALEEIGGMGFTRIGLDSEAGEEIEAAVAGARIAPGARRRGQGSPPADAGNLRHRRAPVDAGRHRQPQRVECGGAGAIPREPPPQSGGLAGAVASACRRKGICTSRQSSYFAAGR